MMKVASYFKNKNKGQSFVELAIVISVLLFLVLGMVEFGNLLNQYINLVDGAREGARYGSNTDPFLNATEGDPAYGTYDYSTVQPSFYDHIFQIIEGDTTVQPPSKRTSAIAPIVLKADSTNPRTIMTRTNGDPIILDDILITFYSVNGTAIVNKWGPHAKYNNGQVSKIPTSYVQSMLVAGAPPTGILVVEIFYSYDELLSFPLFNVAFPDPMPVHTYAVMPLASAEATPVP